jgi:GNAT superfamily N-acetyltransferase
VTVTLRPARRADIPALAGLTRRCDESHRAWAGPDLPVPPRDAEALEWDIRFARSGAWIAVAEDGDGDGTIVGFSAYVPSHASDHNRTLIPGLAYVSDVFVDPAHWRRGIARQLMAAGEVAMRAAGYDRAELWTLESSPAELLYQALGWARDGRRGIYEPMNLPTIAYRKVL